MKLQMSDNSNVFNATKFTKQNHGSDPFETQNYGSDSVDYTNQIKPNQTDEKNETEQS